MTAAPQTPRERLIREIVLYEFVESGTPPEIAADIADKVMRDAEQSSMYRYAMKRADHLLSIGWCPREDAVETNCFDCQTPLVGPFCPECWGADQKEAGVREGLEQAAKCLDKIADAHGDAGKHGSRIVTEEAAAAIRALAPAKPATPEPMCDVCMGMGYRCHFSHGETCKACNGTGRAAVPEKETQDG